MSRWFSSGEMPPLWPDCAQRQTWLLTKGNVQLWHGTPYEVQAHWASHGGSVLNFAFSTAILTTQVQRRVDAAKEAKKTVDPKDETVRGALPLFKLRSREDREQWRKLAFPVAETVQVGAEYRKYTCDSAIMATIILDLQPFNQVNRWEILLCIHISDENICSAGFQMLCGALDPSFSLSSDFYYRSLLAKVYRSPLVLRWHGNFLRSTTRARQRSKISLPRKSHSL